MDEITYKKMNPAGTSSPNSMGYEKSTRKTSLHEAHSINQRLCNMRAANELAKRLKPLIGNSINHVNTKEFVKDIKNTILK